MKTIIAKSYQKEKILHDLAKQSNGVIKDTQVLSLENALHEEANDEFDLLLQLSRKLKGQEVNYPIYGDMFCFPDFFQEIIDFTKQCILWKIQPSTLSDRNDNEKELKNIVNIAFTLDFKEKETIANQTNRVNQLKGQDIELYPSFYNDLYHYGLYNQLKKQFPVAQFTQNNPTVEIRHSLNTRQEIEAIAQDICNTGKSCNIVLASYKNQYPVLRQVFQRYNIPFSSVKDTAYLHIGIIYAMLITFAYRKDRDSFLNLLTYNCFRTSCPQLVYDYLQQRMVDASFPTTMSTTLQQLNVFSKDSIRYEYIEKKVDSFVKKIEADYNLLMSSVTPQQMLENAYVVMQKNKYLSDANELKLALKIRSTIQNIGKSVQEDDIPFLASLFERLTVKSNNYNNDFCVVTDLTHPVTARENSYVVGCSGTNYPGFTSCTGLFDEKYVSQVQQYPSLNKRHDVYMEQIKWISNCATEIIYYSYPTNDYEGREITLSFEIEKTYPLKKAQLWNLETYKEPNEKQHMINPQIAQTTFTKNGEIHGSISTIEGWFKCPYSYFIKSGLKIRKNIPPAVNALTVGNILHGIMDQAVQGAIATNAANANVTGYVPVNYTAISEQEILDIIEPYFESLKVIYPNDVPIIESTQKRLVAGLLTKLKFLSDAEKHTSFKPKETEYQFNDVQIVNSVNVYLDGKIDRLDECNNNLLRIIDYKSSEHTLSEPNVKAGIQLQLLTYIIVEMNRVAQNNNRTAVGAYYASLKAENFLYPAITINRTKITPSDFSDISYNQNAQSMNKLTGWTLTDTITELDDDKKHIKATDKRYRKNYDLVKQCIEELYTYFSNQLMDGNIDLHPLENACKYCDYHSICRFQGQEEKPKPLVMEDTDLKG